MADTEKKYHLDNIDLKEAFEMFDADDDGEITLEELEKVWIWFDEIAYLDWIDYNLRSWKYTVSILPNKRWRLW